MKNLWYSLYIDTLEQVTGNMNIVDVAAERVSVQVIGYGKTCTAPIQHTLCGRINNV